MNFVVDMSLSCAIDHSSFLPSRVTVSYAVVNLTY